DLAPPGLEADLLSERPVQLDRAHHHPGEAERAAQLADEPRGVERRAARQLGPLDEDDVAPAEPREPVEDRAAADTAADHDHLGAGLQRGPFRGGPPSSGEAEGVPGKDAGSPDSGAIGATEDAAWRGFRPPEVMVCLA